MEFENLHTNYNPSNDALQIIMLLLKSIFQRNTQLNIQYTFPKVMKQ